MPHRALGLVVARLGRLTEAGTLLAEALDGLRRMDAEDPRLHSIAANLAEIRHMQGRLPAAEALYREALALRRKALGASALAGGRCQELSTHI